MNGSVSLGLTVAETLSFQAEVSGAGTWQVGPNGSLNFSAAATSIETLVNAGFVSILPSVAGGTVAFRDVVGIGTGQFRIVGGTNAASATALELPGSLASLVDFDTNFGELILDSP